MNRVTAAEVGLGAAMATSDGEPFARAVGRVLPALNIHPDSLRLDSGTVRRARRRPPWLRALRGVKQVLVYVGTVSPDEPDHVVGEAASSALAALTDAARAECEKVLVVWEGANEAVHAAAYSLTRERELGRLLATSWSDPASWLDPMIDASQPMEDVLEDALARLREVVDTGPTDSDFGPALERAFKIVDVVLSSAGGEGQHTAGQPDHAATRERWSSWLTWYELSVRDEWHRVRGNPASARIRAAPPMSHGILSGRKVFLSYSRPDATTIARPVLEALRSQGADVWFDQEEPLELGWLDGGLATTIAGCDAYVLCASDEFFERAGYATQEVAWAVEKWHGDSTLRSIVVVTQPDTILPSLAQQWPIVKLSSLGEPDLGPVLAAAIREAPPAPATSAAVPSVAGQPLRLPTLAAEADPAILIARVRHRKSLYDVPAKTVIRVAGSSDRDADTSRVADRLRQIGAGLDWDGSLVGVDGWPDDPLIRAYRWMLGSSRAIASVRWPLSGDLDELDDVAADVEIIATQPIPVLEWPDATCWGDEERRLLLRFHLSVLRLLDQLLTRGLWGGLSDVPTATLDQWLSEVPGRRQECIDALIGLRLIGGLSWRGDPPVWDRLYEYWYEALIRGRATSAVPAEVRVAILAQVSTLSAMAAQVTWHSARSGRAAEQTFRGGTTLQPTTYGVRICGRREEAAGMPSGGRHVLVELGDDKNGQLTIRAAWSGFETPDDALTSSPPDALSQAVNSARA